ncbi:MAG: STAS domain-containing protein, partial [Isosphaeraceae bacterium]
MTIVNLIDNRVAVMELLDLLDHAVLDGWVGNLLLDFAGIQQVSSAALGKLVKLVSHAQRVRKSLKFCDLHSDMRHVFRITQLDRIFAMYDTRAE